MKGGVSTGSFVSLQQQHVMAIYLNFETLRNFFDKVKYNKFLIFISQIIVKIIALYYIVFYNVYIE